LDPVLVAVLSGVLGLGMAVAMAYYVLKQPQGAEKVREISTSIKEGALAFLGREYRVLAIFVVAVAIILGVVPNLGWLISLAFAFGALCSGLAGFVGMRRA
jgi:K(+)-stimulated pyrophosphate-energized sodium pump